MENEEQAWRKAELDIKCVLEHVAVPGDDFMPYGWCGACETCNSMRCPDVCEACSYTEKYDLKQPVEWPCLTERNRLFRVHREEEEARLAELKRKRLNKSGF